MIKRSLLLVIFCLAALLPAQAQVVIKERVEIQSDTPHFRPDTSAFRPPQNQQQLDSLAAFSTGISGFVAPQSGNLLLLYNSAFRAIDAIPDASYLSILRNNSPLPDDPVLNHFSWPLQGYRTYNTCHGHQFLATFNYAYFSPAHSIVNLGRVEKGDTFLFAYTNDKGTVGGTAYPSTTPGGPSWDLIFSHFAPCFWDISEQVHLVALIQPEIRFLRQNDEELPSEGEEAALMVSQHRVDTGLDPEVAFLSPYSSPDADPDTFRPQIKGMSTGQDLKFRVEVFRKGQPTGYNEVFDSVSGSLPGEGVVYRGKQHLRLVSNAAPDLFPAGAQYDDEYLGRQTIRVELEDTVRVTLLVNGADTDNQAELPVGRPAEEDGPNAVRRAELNFLRYDKLPSSSDSTANTVLAERASEDWAQAGIYFKTISGATFSDESIKNTLTIRFIKAEDRKNNKASADGSLGVDIVIAGDTLHVGVNYALDETLQMITERLRNAIVAASGTFDDSNTLVRTAESDPSRKIGQETLYNVPVPIADAKRLFVISGLQKPAITVSNFQDTGVMDLDKASFNYNNLERHELPIVAGNLRDSLDQSIDVLVVPDGGIKSQATLTAALIGLAFNDTELRRFPSYPFSKYMQYQPEIANAIFLIEPAADLMDDFPTVLGHELGHVLQESHEDNTNNLMYYQAPFFESRSSGTATWYRTIAGVTTPIILPNEPAKRLLQAQAYRVRCSSAPLTDQVPACFRDPADANHPVLLQKKSKSQ